MSLIALSMRLIKDILSLVISKYFVYKFLSNPFLFLPSLAAASSLCSKIDSLFSSYLIIRDFGRFSLHLSSV